MLVKTNLEAEIKRLLNACKDKNSPKDSDYFAEQLAEIIDSYIKTAAVSVNAGIPVSTTGSATAQTGFTTSPGNGTIS